MHSIHLPEVHVPRVPGLYPLCVAAAVCFTLAALTYGVAAIDGGEVYNEQLGGAAAFGWAVAGWIVSIGCMLVTRPTPK